MWVSGSTPPVSEAELHSFVDGGLDRARREAVEAHLATAPDDAARVTIWQAQNEWIRAAFARIESPPPAWPAPPEPKLHCEAVMADPRKPGHSGWGFEASSWHERWFWPLIGLAFAAGGLATVGAAHLLSANAPEEGDGGRILAPQAIPGMAQSETAMKGLPEPAAPLLPNLTFDSYKLTGVQSLPGHKGQKLCLFYARSNAGPLTLCVESIPGPSESPLQPTGHSPAAAVSWRQRGADYVLTGTLAEPELRSLADSVRAQIEAFDAR
ncbi:MAG TPA: hypothetical protein VME69_05960 [Methylocella sp.]|nr:hypothetical protein [Methylocella sp.]